MDQNKIRIRYKKTGKIYEVPLNLLRDDGTLSFIPPELLRKGHLLPKTYLKEDEYEILPQEDFFEFRRQTARQILCTLLSNSYNRNEVVKEAIKLTDELINKL